jgi:hypothetical protein
MRPLIPSGAVLLGLWFGVSSVQGGTPETPRAASRFSSGGETLTLYVVTDARAGEARLRAVRPRGAVTFERSAIVLEPFGDTGDVPVRIVIDFPASQGAATLETDRQADFVVGSVGRARPLTYHEVRYRGIAPGADLVFHAEGGQLVHSVVVAAGATPSTVRLRYRGVRGLSVADDGGLDLDTPGGLLHEEPATFYQEVRGTRRVVTGGYRVMGMNELTFWASSNDAGLPLIIDGVTP